MSKRIVIGPDNNTERTGAQLYRDVRPGSTRFLDLVRTAFGGFLIIGLGFIGVIEPASLNLVLLGSLGIALYTLSGAVVLPFRLPVHSKLKDRNHPLPGSRKPRPAAGTYYLGHIWNELWWNLGDGGDQAAFCAGVSITSTPSRKVMPWMTLGN